MYSFKKPLLYLLLGLATASFGQEIEAQNILGVSEILAEKGVTKQKVRSEIEQTFLFTLKNAENWDKRYDTLSNNKVITVRYFEMPLKINKKIEHQALNVLLNFSDKDVTFYYYIDRWECTYDYETLEAAKKVGMENILSTPGRQSEYKYKYLHLYINDSLNIPDSLVDKLYANRKNILEKNITLLRKSKKEVILNTILLMGE